MKHRLIAAALCAGLSLGAAAAAHAEVSKIAVAREYGISYLPLMVMQDHHLIEKQAAARGVKDLKVEWVKFAGGNVMNEALLSGSLQFASGGVAPMVIAWARTRDNYGIKGVAALNAMPLYLNTDNPDVKTIKDFTSKDKIGLPAVKVSIQAVTLQMAAEKAFGPGQEHKLDPLTVSMSHPDAMAALASHAITAHFGGPPFEYQELKMPGVHTVLNSYDVLGGPASFNLVWTTSKFYKDNPKVYAAYVAALQQAIDEINHDKKAAAEEYLKDTHDTKDSVDFILKMLDDPQLVYTTTPQHVMKYVRFMHKVGTIKVLPKSWKELFFPNVDKLAGS
ncbi:MAG: ABC transporter substrate-binding protein [Betaproteobacteria bacterium]|nr:ABC transporter substrate-binding protein [Betaproteobacteria bacterium]MDE1955576.1 ABC transporter substrate-binding protein [Betaproteobacteria bacterium]MDE2153064.1 ABC transporter substrate-binding protein [Betaproteobacteria bacterium]MDE2477465.1 ABC transporter substrate-binding protein [Betaproteobacteria bacterium]